MYNSKTENKSTASDTWKSVLTFDLLSKRMIENIKAILMLFRYGTKGS